MSATKIMSALEAAHLQNPAAGLAAKSGFLEWLFCLPDGANASIEARKALQGLDGAPVCSDAGAQFLEYLRDAARPLVSPGRRGGASGRRRVLH
ncbi:MAG: hypothetical protein AAF891_01545 [Pseudomonadota bacterium]